MAKLGVKFEPIVPTKPVVDLKAPGRISGVMRQSGGDFAGLMRPYPPALPWKSRTPTSGPRAGGRRTGNLGRNWNLRFGPFWFEVGNAVDYAGFVQGFKDKAKPKEAQQTAVMRGRNWQSLTDVKNKQEPKLIAQLKVALKQRR